MPFILGGTGEYGVAMKDKIGKDYPVVKRETFADAKSYAVQVADEYVQHLRNNHNLSTHFQPGEHPSTSTPRVKVTSTMGETWYVIEIQVLAEYEDGTPNTLMDRIYQVGWLTS